MGAFEDFVNAELPARLVRVLSGEVGFAGDPNVGAPTKVSSAPSGTVFVDETAEEVWWRLKTAGTYFKVFPQAGGAAPTLQDEGTPLAGAPHTTIDYVGAGVTTTDKGSGKAEVNITGGGGGGGTADFLYPSPLISGHYYGPPGRFATTFVVDTLFAAPFVFVGGNIDQMEHVISTITPPIGGEKIRFGIYDDLNGAPDTLLKDSGEIVLPSGGSTHVVAFVTTLAAGLYWVAWVSDSTGFRPFQASSIGPFGPIHPNIGWSTADSQDQLKTFTKAFTFGPALPSTFGAGTYTAVSGVLVRLGDRDA